MGYTPVSGEQSDRLLSKEQPDGPSHFPGEDEYFYRAQRKASKFNIIGILLSASTLVVALILLLTVWTQGNGQCAPGDERETIQTTYGRNRSRMSLAHEFDPLWKPMTHPTYGMIKIDKPEEHNGFKSGEISLLHSLHCLSSFRKALQDQREGKDVGVNDKDDAHWPHCFDYLYQTLLCHADDTIEVPPSPGSGISGEDTPRTCGNADKVFQMYEEKGLAKQH